MWYETCECLSYWISHDINVGSISLAARGINWSCRHERLYATDNCQSVWSDYACGIFDWKRSKLNCDWSWGWHCFTLGSFQRWLQVGLFLFECIIRLCLSWIIRYWFSVRYRIAGILQLKFVQIRILLNWTFVTATVKWELKHARLFLSNLDVLS